MNNFKGWTSEAIKQLEAKKKAAKTEISPAKKAVKSVAKALKQEKDKQRCELLSSLTGGETWVAEHKFHTKRKWRLDYACVRLKIALEFEGGVMGTSGKSRHTSPVGMDGDMEKYAEAQMQGWLIIRVHGAGVKPDKKGRLKRANIWGQPECFDRMREAYKARIST